MRPMACASAPHAVITVSVAGAVVRRARARRNAAHHHLVKHPRLVVGGNHDVHALGLPLQPDDEVSADDLLPTCRSRVVEGDPVCCCHRAVGSLGAVDVERDGGPGDVAPRRRVGAVDDPRRAAPLRKVDGLHVRLVDCDGICDGGRVGCLDRDTGPFQSTGVDWNACRRRDPAKTAAKRCDWTFPIEHARLEGSSRT